MKLRNNVFTLLQHNKSQYLIHSRHFSRKIQPRSKKYKSNVQGLVTDEERSELLAQSRVEDSNQLFHSVLNTRKKIANVTTQNRIQNVTELSDEYKSSLEESALVWKKKSDKVKKDNAFLNLDRVINHSKLMYLKMPSPELQNYLNACRIASLLRLDPEKDAALIELKQRIQWILQKHRLSAVPPLDFFLKHRYFIENLSIL